MSFETAPVDLGASIAPPRAPTNTAASASTIHRVRKACLLSLFSLKQVVRDGPAKPGRPAIIRFVTPPYVILLMRSHEMRSPVLLPARFIMFAAERTLFAPADGVHSRRGNA